MSLHNGGRQREIGIVVLCSLANEILPEKITGMRYDSLTGYSGLTKRYRINEVKVLNCK